MESYIDEENRTGYGQPFSKTFRKGGPLEWYNDALENQLPQVRPFITLSEAIETTVQEYNSHIESLIQV